MKIALCIFLLWTAIFFMASSSILSVVFGFMPGKNILFSIPTSLVLAGLTTWYLKDR